MRNMAKLFLTGIILMVIGALTCGISFAVMGFRFDGLNNEPYVTREYEIPGDFQNITVENDWGDIVFAASEDGRCTVMWYGNEKNELDSSVKDGTLTLKGKDEREWYNMLMMRGESMRVTVVLPKKDYDALSVENDGGSVTILGEFCFQTVDVSVDLGDVVCLADVKESMKIETDTGSVTIEGQTTGEVEISTQTGNINTKNVICQGSMKMTAGTGSITLEGCDADTIFIETCTGNVKGTLLSGKVFDAKSELGKVDVPPSTEGGKCEITVETGSIHIRVEQERGAEN